MQPTVSNRLHAAAAGTGLRTSEGGHRVSHCLSPEVAKDLCPLLRRTQSLRDLKRHRARKDPELTHINPSDKPEPAKLKDKKSSSTKDFLRP